MPPKRVAPKQESTEAKLPADGLSWGEAVVEIRKDRVGYDKSLNAWQKCEKCGKVYDMFSTSESEVFCPALGVPEYYCSRKCGPQEDQNGL